MKPIPFDFDAWLEISDRLFYVALASSLAIHLSVVTYLSLNKSDDGRKSVRPLEVTYERIKTKPVLEEERKTKSIEAVKEKALPKRVEILPKDANGSAIFGDQVKDMSKLSDHMRFSQKESPRIKTLDMS